MAPGSISYLAPSVYFQPKMVLPDVYRPYLPPIPIYCYNCLVCMKPYWSIKAVKRHESDANGPRMKNSVCKFLCPEGRPSEMKVHLIDKHKLPTGSPPIKRRRTSPRVTQIPATVAPPTVRVAPEKPAVESYNLAPNQTNFFSQLGGLD